MMLRAQNISVVIPTYQRGGILLQTLHYLLELPVQAGEILVVDQTAAHPPEVLKEFHALESAGEIRRIILSRPSIPHAMNVGLQEAKGAIVLFLDDDILPDENLISSHSKAHADFPEAVAVAGQVLQPEDGWSRAQSAEGKAQGVDAGGLWKDLDFKFNGITPAWVENVMAGNLSVRRDRALQVGGFDENFIPPVSFRFETEFAKRLILAGGRIRFSPDASIRHLRADQGGTRSHGSHLTSASPIHGVGDYYYALRHGHGWGRFLYIGIRPFRQVRTKFHLGHPWFIPIKLLGEIRAIGLAFKLFGKHRRDSTEGSRRFYDMEAADKKCKGRCK